MFLSVPAVNALMCGLLVPEAPAVRKNVDLLRLKSCLPAASALPILKSENLGTFSFYEQLSDKLNDLSMYATYRA
jgi:hypothetical protein